MNRFGAETNEIPKGIWIFQVRDRVPLLSVNKAAAGFSSQTVSNQVAKNETYLGNKMGSRIKNIGVLLPTRSQTPSSVKNLIANPRGSLAVSADPLSPPTVLKRTVTWQDS